MKSRVALVRCSSYDEQTVAAAVQKGIDLLGGMEQFIHPGDRPDPLQPLRHLREALPRRAQSRQLASWGYIQITHLSVRTLHPLLLLPGTLP